MSAKNKQTLTQEIIFSELRKHSDILRKYKDKKIGLFGPYARGEQKKNSEINFLIDFKKPTFDNFMDLNFCLEDLFDKKVHILTPEGLNSIRIKEVADEVKREVIFV